MTHSIPSPDAAPVAASRPAGQVMAALFTSALGLAVMVPSLLLQGVATRPRTPDAEDAAANPVEAHDDHRADSVVDRQLDADPSAPGLGDQGVVVEPPVGDKPSPAEPRGQRPRRRADKGARGPAAEGDDAAPARQAGRKRAPGGGRRERGPNGRAARPERPVDAEADPLAAATLDDAELDPGAGSALDSTTSGLAGKQPRGPVSFEEVQAAHAVAARSYRDLRIAVNEAYRLISRLNIERYEAQLELAELKGLPPPERPPERSWKSAAKASSVRASRPSLPARAHRVKRARPPEAEEEEQLDPLAVKAIARRRQLTVLGIVLAVAVFAVIYWLVDWHWFPNILDRQALAEMAGIGFVMQIFFLIFFMFRLTTLTGKGKSWLFPTPEEEEWKRRRKRVRGR